MVARALPCSCYSVLNGCLHINMQFLQCVQSACSDIYKWLLRCVGGCQGMRLLQCSEWLLVCDIQLVEGVLGVWEFKR